MVLDPAVCLTQVSGTESPPVINPSLGIVAAIDLQAGLNIPLLSSMATRQAAQVRYLQ